MELTMARWILEDAANARFGSALFLGGLEFLEIGPLESASNLNFFDVIDTFDFVFNDIAIDIDFANFQQNNYFATRTLVMVNQYCRITARSVKDKDSCIDVGYWGPIIGWATFSYNLGRLKMIIV